MYAITVQQNINGVDLAALAAITKRYREAPELGHERFEARVDWLGGYRTDARLGSFIAVLGDEPPKLGGGGTGPAPEEMLLGAVAQCLIVGIAGSASARGIAIRALSVDADGVVNLTAAYGLEDASPGFQSISLTVHLDADTSREELDALVQSALASAPIPNTVARPVPVSARLA